MRRPSEWPDAQAELRRRLDAGEPVAETPVHARWVVNDATWIPRYGGLPGAAVASFQGLRALRRRKARGPAGAYVLLWLGSRAPGPPDLVVPVDEDGLPSRAGQADTIAVGEIEPNGGLGVVLGGTIVFPSYNPQVPWGDLRKLR